MSTSIRIRINKRLAAIQASDKDLRSVYSVTFFESKLIFSESVEGRKRIVMTYGEVNALSRSVAAEIHDRIGAGGVYVALDMDNGVDWIIAFWAILISGNKPYLVNRWYPDSLIEKIVRELNITSFVGTKKRELCSSFLDYDTLRSANRDPMSLECFENAIALSSSATSICASVCVYSGEEIVEQILNSSDVIRKNGQIVTAPAGSVIKHLVVLPFFHVFGLFATYFWFSVFGAEFVFPADISCETLMKTCRACLVTHIFAVPLFWQTVEREVLRNANYCGREKSLKNAMQFSSWLQNVCPYFGRLMSRTLMRSVTRKVFGRSIRFCISGGASLKDSTLRFINALSYPLYNGYGMTETGITSVELRHRPAERNMNSIGKPFRSVEYRINDDGVILVKGDSLCKTLIINGVRQKREEWFNTGDIAEVDKSGNYYIRGRKRDVINAPNGESINPDMLEKEFCVPYSQRYCIFASQLRGNEAVAIVVEIKKYISPEAVHETIESVKAQNLALPVPLRASECYITFDMIAPPNTLKISRVALGDCIAEGRIRLVPFDEYEFNSEGSDDLDMTAPMARKLAEIIAGVLGVSEESIAPDANIMLDMGGNSMDYFTVIAKIKEEFGVTLYMDEKHCCYTLREFCKETERNL